MKVRVVFDEPIERNVEAFSILVNSMNKKYNAMVCTIKHDTENHCVVTWKMPFIKAMEFYKLPLRFIFPTESLNVSKN